MVLPTAFAPALGPVLGGVLVTGVSWRWVFYLNVPMGVAGFVFGALFLPERESGVGRFDIAGFVLAGAGFAARMCAVSEGPSRGGAPPLIMAAAWLVSPCSLRSCGLSCGPASR
ncbi:MAG: MFS transporter [Frankiaceae bacterium]